MKHECAGMIVFVFFNDTATTEIYTLSLHDALPISKAAAALIRHDSVWKPIEQADRDEVSHLSTTKRYRVAPPALARSEEHTSELQSRQYLVCRLLLEKKKTTSDN